MTSATILTICSLLDSKIEETKKDADKWYDEYRKEQKIACDEAEEKGLDVDKAYEDTHDYHSYNVWQAYHKLLIQLRAAKDDFTSHDFH